MVMGMVMVMVMAVFRLQTPVPKWSLKSVNELSICAFCFIFSLQKAILSISDAWIYLIINPDKHFIHKRNIVLNASNQSINYK